MVQTIYFPDIFDDNYYIVCIPEPDDYIIEMDENNSRMYFDLAD